MMCMIREYNDTPVYTPSLSRSFLIRTQQAVIFKVTLNQLCTSSRRQIDRLALSLSTKNTSTYIHILLLLTHRQFFLFNIYERWAGKVRSGRVWCFKESEYCFVKGRRCYFFLLYTRIWIFLIFSSCKNETKEILQHLFPLTSRQRWIIFKNDYRYYCAHTN